MWMTGLRGGKLGAVVGGFERGRLCLVLLGRALRSHWLLSYSIVMECEARLVGVLACDEARC
jgi:hypothetical protein